MSHKVLSQEGGSYMRAFLKSDASYVTFPIFLV